MIVMQKKAYNIEPIEHMNRGSFVEETMIQMTWFDCWISLMDRNVKLPYILELMWGYFSKKPWPNLRFFYGKCHHKIILLNKSMK